MDYINNLTNNLTATLGNALPSLVGAILVLIIGFFLAGLIQKLVLKLLGKTKIDERIAKKFESSVRIDKFVAKLCYYLIVVYTLVVVLSLLGATGVLLPLQAMLQEFVGYLPNIIGAGIIAFAGYVISKLGSEATGFLSERIENFGKSVGISAGSISLSKIVKQVVFILIFIPILIVALDTLNMDAISGPASEMLGSLLNAIPQIIAAFLLLAVFYIVGKYVVSILSDLLGNLGLDTFSNKLGLNAVLGEAKLSKLIGNIAFFFILFTGIIAASGKLGMFEIQDILNNVFNVAGKVFFGLIILLAGVFISNIASNALAKAETSSVLIPIMRFAILGIFLAFALHTMGIAESIVNLAFGLTLGGIAVAFALSFGLGGREAAGKEMEAFFQKLKKKN